MNWRTICLRKAANILEKFNHKRLADEVRNVEIPDLDGSGMYQMRWDEHALPEFVWHSFKGTYEPGAKDMQGADLELAMKEHITFLIPVSPHEVRTVPAPGCKCGGCKCR